MSRPRTITEVVNDYRQRLLDREAQTAAEFAAIFEQVRAELEQRIAALAALIEDAIARGEEVSPAWAYQQQRFRALLAQTEAAIREVAPAVAARITADQAFAVELAGQQARQLTLWQVPPAIRVSFATLPREALADLIGALADGSPLRSLLDELGTVASQRMRDELVTGLAVGRNPREVARRMRDVPNLTRRRAELISRTEMLRANRTANLRTYQQNAAIVQGWRWTAALDARTCLACVAMHGREFPVTVPFGSHPACRCSPVPLTRWATPVESGVEWFERQPEPTKLGMLGPAKFRAYRAAEFRIEELVGFRVDPRWGHVRWEKSLRAVRAERPADLAQAAD